MISLTISSFAFVIVWCLRIARVCFGAMYQISSSIKFFVFYYKSTHIEVADVITMFSFSVHRNLDDIQSQIIVLAGKIETDVLRMAESLCLVDKLNVCVFVKFSEPDLGEREKRKKESEE